MIVIVGPPDACVHTIALNTYRSMKRSRKVSLFTIDISEMTVYPESLNDVIHLITSRVNRINIEAHIVIAMKLSIVYQLNISIVGEAICKIFDASIYTMVGVFHESSSIRFTYFVYRGYISTNSLFF